MLALESAVSGNNIIDHATTGNSRQVDIVEFKAWHLDFVSVQPEQWASVPVFTKEYGMALEQYGNGFSAFVGDEVIACAGIMLLWPGRAQVWALMSSKISEYKFVIHRTVKRYIDNYSCARLECVVDPDFKKSVLWAERLGFRIESYMPKYGIHGETMCMFVRLEY